MIKQKRENLKYCNICILPNTRPNLIFDKTGTCDGCKKIQKKTNSNLRLKEFKELIKKIKKEKKL